MRLLQSIKNEWQLICHDAWLKALLFWMPVILAIVIWGVFSAGIARDLPIGVVDHDNSSVSRSLIRNYNASPTLAVVNHFHSMEHANAALREGSIYALVIIPNSLEKNTLLGKAPQVTAFYNSQFILIGKLINSAMLSAHGTYVAQIETFKDLASTRGNVEQAIGEALPISSQISPLFNANTHYGQFLVTAVIPAMWQIIIIATIVLVWARPLQNTSLDVWLAHLNFNDELIKLIPYVLIFLDTRYRLPQCVLRHVAVAHAWKLAITNIGSISFGCSLHKCCDIILLYYPRCNTCNEFSGGIRSPCICFYGRHIPND